MPKSASKQAKLKLALMGLLALVLLGGVAAQYVIPAMYPREATVPLPLSKLLPETASGWEVKDLPLADTETLQASVANVLQYDDTIFRTFTRGSVTFGVYISYWLPGKVSYYDAGVHTPDTCWVYNGWERLSRTSSVSLDLNSRGQTKPAEIGSFSKNREVLHVAFWHLVGKQVNTYDQYSWHEGLQGRLERFPNYLRDFRRFGIDQGQEQSFVRISSSIPVDQLLAMPDVATILASLTPLGLFNQPAPVTGKN